MGKVIFPNEYDEILTQASKPEIIFALETERIGVNHIEAGGRLARAWGNPGSGAFIDINGSDLTLPADGSEHSVTVRINSVIGSGGALVMPVGGIPESDYSNNRETVTWQANAPAVAVVERIQVHEN